VCSERGFKVSVLVAMGIPAMTHPGA